MTFRKRPEERDTLGSMSKPIEASIVVVDDEPSIRELLVASLHFAGFEVNTAASGSEAIEVIEKVQPDLIVLDVMLPDIDGFTVTRRIRQEGINAPVLFLTARDDTQDKIMGLTVGGDDYVTKPFSPIVLAARVRTLLKREGRAGAPLEQLGKLSVNELRREVMVENKPIDLTPKEYELLIYFKNNRAIALSRESILNAVWVYDYFGDLRTVDTHVKKLRAKLGECGTMIETVRGYGYRFEV